MYKKLILALMVSAILLSSGCGNRTERNIKNLKEPESEIRTCIVMALGDLREKKSIDALLSMTGDENPEVFSRHNIRVSSVGADIWQSS
ncbi:HEAT repeat domain-containing protein [bacterium]|nr:HEAT repeat domain-containing protein [bacterium]